MAAEWHNKHQKSRANKLVLYRLRGFPPWPGLVVAPQPRAELQGPMNPLCPAEDAVFDRDFRCVRRGSGMKVGDTVCAHPYLVIDEKITNLKDGETKKATVKAVGLKTLQVEFKHNKLVQEIPKRFAELISCSKQQRQASGKVKKPTGKIRDVALQGKHRGKLPGSHVLVYSFGDEMWRKVRASTLCPFTPATLDAPYRGGPKTVKQALQAFNQRGFVGEVALKEAQAEQDRRDAESKVEMKAKADQMAFRVFHNLPTTPRPKFRTMESSSPEKLVLNQLPKVSAQCDLESLSDCSSLSDMEEEEDQLCLATIFKLRQQQVPVHLAGMIVPFSEQLETGNGQLQVPAVSESQFEAACQLLNLSATDAKDRSVVNRARRQAALRFHPDKALPANKAWATKKWHDVDAAHFLLLSKL